jgi:hypothetical protein
VERLDASAAILVAYVIPVKNTPSTKAEIIEANAVPNPLFPVFVLMG